MDLDFNNMPVFEDAEVRKQRIADGMRVRIRDLVKFLYPRAVITSDARIGDIMGEPGSSLSICIKGEAAGRWVDHATGEKGDVFGLWAAAHNFDPRRDFNQVLLECEQWLGGSPSPRTVARHAIEAAKPAPEPTLERATASFAYLSSTGEHLFDVVRYDLFNQDGSAVLKGGKPDKIYKPKQPDGRMGYPPGPRPLYRLPDIDRAQEIVFCEGEKCADAVHSCGWAATSAPGGAQTNLDAIDWRPLAGKCVVLWPDNDKPGFSLMERVRSKLAEIGCAVRTLRIPGDKPLKWDAADALREGFDIQAFLKAPTTVDHGLKGYWLDEIAYAYEPELVEGLIPATGVGVVFGPSSAGKSFVTVDWATRISSGGKVLNRHTEASGVLYFAAEGQAGLKKRLVAARQAHSLDEVVLPFNYLPALLDLSRAEAGDIERLCLYAEEASREMKLRGAPLRVIIVDTLAAAAPSADENAQKDMGPVMLAFHRMAYRLSAVVILVAHTGKDVTRGLRGWSGIRANADFAIECEVEKDELTGETIRRSLWLEKCKDGPDGFTLSDYALRQVQLGAKRSGEPDTTCCVEWSAAAASRPGRRTPVYSGALQIIIDMLQDEPKTTSEVATALGVDRSNAGKKLRTLQEDGAIFSRDDGPRKIWVVCNSDLPSSNQ